MTLKSSVALDRHLDAAITWTRWGAFAFLALAGMVTALVNLSALFTGGPMPEEAVAEVGGVFFYMFLGVIGMFLIFGFIGSIVLHAAAERFTEQTIE